MQLLHRYLYLLTLIVLVHTQVYGTSYTWAGGTSTAWNNAANWSPNTGFPGTGDDVTVNGAGTFQPVLNGNLTINNLSVSGGTLDLNSNTLTVNGTPSFTGGNINNGALSISSSGTCTFGAGTFGAAVSGNASDVLFNGATFNSTLNIDKTGSGNSAGTGNTTFNSTTTISNSGSGILYLASTTGDIFNNNVTFTNTGAGVIQVAYNGANTQFNGNVLVNSTAGSGVQFGQSSGTATLATGFTISVGATGFTTGSLRLRNFTQSGATAQSITLTSAGILYFQSGTTFNGNVTTTSPEIYLNGATFNGTNSFTKNGTNTNNCVGGNTFTGTTTITNSGSGDLILGYTSADTYSDLTVNNTGTKNIYLAYNSSGNQFNGNTVLNAAGSGTTNYIEVAYKTGSTATFSGTVTANNTGTSTYYNLIRFSLDGATTFNDDVYVNSTVPSTDSLGIYFGYRQPNTGSITLANSKKIMVGGTGFAVGNLYIYSLTQTGATAQSITLTGSAKLVIGTGTTFNADLTVSAPNIFLNGATFNGICSFTKTGSASFNSSDGGNTFNGATTFINSAGNYILLANVTRDIFNADVTFTNTSTSLIYPAFKGGNTLFNGNIYVNSTLGNGVYFCQNTGTATLADTKTISVGGSGFSKGALKLRNFTQTGTTAQNITLTGTATVYYETGTTFDADLTSVSPQLYLNGSTFNGTSSFTKNGATDNLSNGGCTFNGVTTITVSGSNYLGLANSSADTYNENVTFAQSSTGAIMPSYNTSCSYLKNITVNSSSVITFGSGGSGTTVINGTVAQSINKSGTADPTFTRLTLNKASNSLTLNTPINISSTLTLTSGIINTTSTNILTMKNGSSTSTGSSSSYINGPMNYDMAFSGSRTLNFPIGKSSDWRPVVLDLSHSSATSYTYNAELFNASANALGWTRPATVNTLSGVHYWDINRYTTGTTTSVPTTDLSGNQTITLYFGTNDQINDGANATICKNTYTATTTWIDIGGTGAPVFTDGSYLTGSISSTSSPTAFNSFSRFTIGNLWGGLNPLPVELLSFENECRENGTLLKWSTASEKNNAFFRIKKSVNGSDYYILADIQAEQNSNSTSFYSYFDSSRTSEVTFYNLKDIDFNGREISSHIIRAKKCPNKQVPMLDIFSCNSGKGPVIQVSNTEQAETIEYNIYNAIGQEILSGSILFEKSPFRKEIDLNGVSKGVYYINCRLENKSYYAKFILF